MLTSAEMEYGTLGLILSAELPGTNPLKKLLHLSF